MSARPALATLTTLAALAACTRGGAPTSPDAAADADAFVVSRDAGGDVADAALPDAGDAVDPRWSSALPLKAKSIGHTSLVYKLTLDGGLVAAFKPRSVVGKRRYRGEIAAYRLATALGLANVPLAMPRKLTARALRAALAGADAEAFASAAVSERDGDAEVVRGALIPWIARLDLLPLEAPSWRAKWSAWLGGAPPETDADRALSGQIAEMIVLDWLTGNWDRWSGGNVGFDRATNTVLFIDNDGAFFDPPPPGPLAKQRALLEGTRRFPRGLVTALRGLDASALARAIGEEEPGRPLLEPAVLAGVAARREQALAVIDAAIAKLGAGVVLVD